MNPIQISASTGCISSAGPSFAGRDPNYIMTDTNRPIAVNELCLQKWGRLMQERSARSTGLASGTRECWYVTNIWVASQHASLFLTKKTRVSCAICEHNAISCKLRSFCFRRRKGCKTLLKDDRIEVAQVAV